MRGHEQDDARGSDASVGVASDRRRSGWFRVAAVLLGLLPFVLVEAALRLWGPDSRTAAMDPYVDLNALRPLFEFDKSTGTYTIGSERLHLFAPASFSAEKSRETFRVFALGGSTTQGEPYSTQTAFPKWLEFRLQAMMPGRRVEVINCGGLSYASYRVAAICREVLEYQPDLIVVYTGHNEFLEKRSYATAGSGPIAVVARTLADNLRSVQVVQRLMHGPASRNPSAERTQMSAEVDALLDYQGGLEDYDRDSQWHAGVVEHYRWNIEQIVDRCQAVRVPVAFVIPTSNILDCPPMKFEIDPQLSPADLDALNVAWEAARAEAAAGNRERAIELLDESLRLDPGHAGSLFLLGRLFYELGDYPQAERFLTEARDADVCPLRATSQIISTLRTSLDEAGVTVADAEELFQQLSPHGLVGDKWLVDHIHPSVAGHQRLADRIADELVSRGVVSPEVSEAEWSATHQERMTQHLASLGEEYYHRGKQRLRGLQLWTQGRAKKVRSDSAGLD